MNASLNGPGPLSERAPGRVRLTRRQMAIALIVAVLGVIAAILTVNSVKSSELTFPAEVSSSKVVDLNFTNSGVVTQVYAKVGQTVASGQVLAAQDTTSLQDQLKADQAAVSADEQALNQASAPQLTGAQKEQDLLQVQQAQTALDNAKASLTAANATASANLAGARAAVTTAQGLANSDTARYTAACPSGPQAPTPGLTGTDLQNAQSAYDRCLNLQQEMDTALANLAEANSQVPVVQSQGTQSVNSAQAAVNTAQSALNLADYQETLQSSAPNSATQSQAQSTLAAAQNQLQQVQQQIKQAQIIAPEGGVIAEVFGAVGETLGPDGVRQYQSPAAISQNQSSSFNLFPSQSVPAQQNNTTGTEPTIEIVGGSQQILAQVPESNVSSLPVGHTAKVSISAINVNTTGTVTEIVLSPTRTSSVSYEVIITLNHTVPGLLPGMSATVQG